MSEALRFNIDLMLTQPDLMAHRTSVLVEAPQKFEKSYPVGFLPFSLLKLRI